MKASVESNPQNSPGWYQRFFAWMMHKFNAADASTIKLEDCNYASSFAELKQFLSVDEFITCYGDDDRYELIDGDLIDMEPTGPHEQVTAFIGRKLNVEIDRQNTPYFIPHRCLIKLLGTETAFRPDAIVLDQTYLENEPLWQQEPVITSGASIKLVVEVVSTNWQNDYARKVEDYAVLGIPEYWIMNYLGLGGREYIGKLKQPAITICTLVEDEYQKQIFRSNDLLVSSVFPELQLTAKQVFASAQFR